MLKTYLLNITHLGFIDSQKLNYCIKRYKHCQFIFQKSSTNFYSTILFECAYFIIPSLLVVFSFFLLYYDLGGSLNVLICISLITKEAKLFSHMFPLKFLIRDADMLQIGIIHTSLIFTLEAIPRREEEVKTMTWKSLKSPRELLNDLI